MLPQTGLRRGSYYVQNVAANGRDSLSVCLYDREKEKIVGIKAKASANGTSWDELEMQTITYLSCHKETTACKYFLQHN